VIVIVNQKHRQHRHTTENGNWNWNWSWHWNLYWNWNSYSATELHWTNLNWTEQQQYKEGKKRNLRGNWRNWNTICCWMVKLWHCNRILLYKCKTTTTFHSIFGCCVTLVINYYYLILSIYTWTYTIYLYKAQIEKNK